MCQDSKKIVLVSMLAAVMASSAFAMDWTQPILDENGVNVTDWQSCPGTNAASPDPAKERCDKILTIGRLTARALLVPNQQQQQQDTPEQKALTGQLALDILQHPDFVPSPDQLKMARDAIGRLPSPLAVARGWAILDKAIK